MKKQHNKRTLKRKKALASSLLLASLIGTTAMEKESAKQCPVMGGNIGSGASSLPMTNKQWWPSQLDVSILHQNSKKANPLGDDFNYATEFAKIDMPVLRKELKTLMRTSQDWWPADFGHYGPFFVRMAWHSAGTYRAYDGRGGARYGLQRFAPQNSWPDNGNLDKARRLLWPIKQKYGQKISWADLMILAGTVAIEDMGLRTLGFGAGRVDVWEPQNDIYWGPEKEWLASERHNEQGELDERLAADELGLIYVNPEGPHGNPDPLAAAARIRETFTRMDMNDEETVALIAGGHTFGKAHGAASADKHVGASPEGAGVEEQGLGWKNSYGKGNAEDTITSGLEGSWTSTPAKWSHQYFSNLLAFEWELTTSPAGAKQWKPKGGAGEGLIPDAHIKDKRHAPMMFTIDIALKKDPAYAKISKNFLENPLEFDEAFAKAWYKLTHRDMGQSRNLLGKDVAPAQLWQDPLPEVDYEQIDAKDIEQLKSDILASGIELSDLVLTAWASASTYRESDRRGGTDGGRLRLAPQKDWEVNQPEKLSKVLSKLEKVQSAFNDAQKGNKKVSLADIIVLGGAAAIEKAATGVKVPFTPGRVDALQEQTNIESFAVLEPRVDGFRNYQAKGLDRPAAQSMVNHAQQLNLTAPEMVALIGGMRSLGATAAYKRLGDFSDRDGQLTNDFFTNLLDIRYKWQKSKQFPAFYEGVDRESGTAKYAATSMDLVIGSNSQLRAIAEVYAGEHTEKKFINDFVKAWTKVMNNGRK